MDEEILKELIKQTIAREDRAVLREIARAFYANCPLLDVQLPLRWFDAPSTVITVNLSAVEIDHVYL